MTKLATYLTDHGIARETFAASIGVDTVSVCRYVLGRRRPRWDVMTRIREATKGAVTADDFAPPPLVPAQSEPRPRRRGSPRAAA